jgi:Zn-dependent metalloprotease
MNRSTWNARQALPLVLLALVYLLALTPLLLPMQAVPPLRTAPPLVRADADLLSTAVPLTAHHPRINGISPAQAYATLAAQTTSPLAVRWDAVTGTPRFITAIERDGRLPYTPTDLERGNPLATALGFLDHHRALFGLRSAAEELRLLRIEPDLQLGHQHVRLDQVYRGLPVFGQQLHVHLDPSGAIVAVNGTFTPLIDLDLQPTISQAQALEVALADLRTQQLLPYELAKINLEPLPDATTLMIYADDAGRATLVWHVVILTTSPLGQWDYFVHARRPTVVHAIDGLMPIKRRITYTANNTTRLPGRKLADEGELPRDEVARAAHEGAGIVYDYFFNTFRRDAYDGQGSPMISTVNYGSDPEDAENAAWIGELGQMIYGDGGRIFRPLSYSLDVIAHEFTHGVVEATANLIYENQSGALNESYSDVFGTMVDRTNWTIGETVIKSPPFPRPYLRSLEDPNARGLYDVRDPLGGVGQPANMREYANLPNTRRANNGGVHVNSGIPNHAAYLIARVIGRDKTEQIYYRALTNYLTPRSNFGDAATATVRAATDLYTTTEIEAVRNALAQVGMLGNATPTGPVAPEPAVPSGGPTAPVPQRPLEPGCSDLIRDGGFETDGVWTEVVRGDTRLIDTQLPRSGTRSAWLGGTDQEPVQYLYQDVRIPANATSIELRYARLIHFEVSGLLGLLAAEATFSALVANTQGDILSVIEEIPSSEGDGRWRDVRFDVTQLAGRTIRLVFGSENPRGNVSSFFVDDVQMIACTTGNAPTAPPTGSNELVYIQGQITDANTGRGINGAQVFVLRPGITARQAAADDNLAANEVLTVGTTDREGVFRTQAAVNRNQTYSVIIIARGYRPILSDGEVAIPANATNPYRINAELRR